MRIALLTLSLSLLDLVLMVHQFDHGNYRAAIAAAFAAGFCAAIATAIVINRRIGGAA